MPPTARWRRYPMTTVGYPVFMTIVLVFVVALDEWSDRELSRGLIANLVGESSVILWASTAVGSFGVGPVAAIWNAIHRPVIRTGVSTPYARIV
jgi:hypothetical protein